MARNQMARWRAALKAAALALAALAAPAAAAVHGEDGAAAPCRIAVLGDSLTAGYGLDPDEAFPARLEAALREAGLEGCVVIDAGVSGDTTAGGRARLAWLLADRPSHVIVELGANDALRALPVAEVEANLDEILRRLEGEGVAALLAGMYAPPNLGPEYARAFAAVYPRLAGRHGVPLYPFFLDGVAGEPDLNLPDGIHPTAEGVAVIVDRMLPAVVEWLTDGAGAASVGGDPGAP